MIFPFLTLDMSWVKKFKKISGLADLDSADSD